MKTSETLHEELMEKNAESFVEDACNDIDAAFYRIHDEYVKRLKALGFRGDTLKSWERRTLESMRARMKTV